MMNRWQSIFGEEGGGIPRRLLLRASAPCVLVAALTASANASAADHFYGIDWNPNIPGNIANEGIWIQINTNLLNTKDCNNFVDHEMWYGVVAGGDYWVEVGFTSGIGQAGCVDKALFWADNRNGGGYHEHYPGNGWSLDAWYNMEIRRKTGCSWNVNIGGLTIGTSTSNCTPNNAGRYAAAGIETTSQFGNGVRGFLSTPQRYSSDSHGFLIPGWNGPTFTQDSPPFITGNPNGFMEEIANVPF
jgi:hypothetical protein